MPLFSIRDVIAVGAAVLGPLIVAAVIVPFRGAITNTNLALVLVVVVVAVAAMGNRFAGAVAALSSAVWFAFLYTQPYEQFTIFKGVDLETTVLLIIVGLVTSQLAIKARRVKVLAVTDADYLTRVHDVTALVQSAAPPTVVIDQVQNHITEILFLHGCRFESGPASGNLPRLEQDGTIMMSHWHWDVERYGFPEREIELRVFGDGSCQGRFLLAPTPGTSPSRQARLTAVTLAGQAGQVLAAASAHQTG
ncbi:DUF4118 domain-containing protein [Acrocarpospora catenulata]|uniref:DUF4118 domain-containing protein n=1 Tax=Acrocarpospora catenulata TaxID=2836182 RepID=UPI001BDA99A9|nr:DUF4118 domain-containing protein [Acrocarpospora catenulata]